MRFTLEATTQGRRYHAGSDIASQLAPAEICVRGPETCVIFSPQRKRPWRGRIVWVHREF